MFNKMDEGEKHHNYPYDIYSFFVCHLSRNQNLISLAQNEGNSELKELNLVNELNCPFWLI